MNTAFKKYLRLSVMASALVGGVALGTTVPVSAAYAQQRIADIRVEGAQRIEPSTVLSYSRLNTGARASQAAFDQSLKALFATGLFADVSLRMQGETLVIKVIENPIINQIAFEGNRRIEDDELLSEIQLRDRQVFTKAKVQEDVARIYQLYRRGGRFSVDVDLKYSIVW